LGHVDHGKTKLLDTIRKTKVAEGESGGITQHIGAYQATVKDKLITFLDTPGHEAFSAIRSRGAKVADIAVLVVGADESVKPQTKEAIKIIKEADIPYIVAINKIDKDGANPQRVRQDLATEEVLTEDWGGKVPVVEISAKVGTNMDELLDMILLVAEVQELKDERDVPASGVVIESHLDKQRGFVATALVQKGVLSVGDWVVVGTVIGKVKSMEDFMGVRLEQAVPAQPVLITGWTDSPDIGRELVAAKDKSKAEKLAKTNIDLAPLFSFLVQAVKGAPTDPKKKILNVIFKSDVTSSLEAIEAAMNAVKSDEIAYHVVHYGVGNITEGDVKTAVSTKASIFGFRVEIENSARQQAEKDGVILNTFDIIYELIEAVREHMAGLLPTETKRTILGKLRVLALFKLEGRQQVIGGKVTTGKLSRGGLIGIVTGEEIKKLGKITQLQQEKTDVAEVQEGRECGLKVELADTSRTIKEGEVIEVYEEEQIKRSL